MSNMVWISFAPRNLKNKLFETLFENKTQYYGIIPF